MASTASTKSSSAAHDGDDDRPQESSLHEHSTISLPALIKFVICFVIGLIVVHLIIYLVFVTFRSAVAQERQITGVNEVRISPPPPRLQPSMDHNRVEAEDLKRLEAGETAELKRRGLLNEDGKPQFTDALLKQIARQSSK